MTRFFWFGAALCAAPWAVAAGLGWQGDVAVLTGLPATDDQQLARAAFAAASWLLAVVGAPWLFGAGALNAAADRLRRGPT